MAETVKWYDARTRLTYQAEEMAGDPLPAPGPIISTGLVFDAAGHRRQGLRRIRVERFKANDARIAQCFKLANTYHPDQAKVAYIGLEKDIPGDILYGSIIGADGSVLMPVEFKRRASATRADNGTLLSGHYLFECRFDALTQTGAFKFRVAGIGTSRNSHITRKAFLEFGFHAARLPELLKHRAIIDSGFRRPDHGITGNIYLSDDFASNMTDDSKPRDTACTFRVGGVEMTHAEATALVGEIATVFDCAAYGIKYKVGDPIEFTPMYGLIMDAADIDSMEHGHAGQFFALMNAYELEPEKWKGLNLRIKNENQWPDILEIVWRHMASVSAFHAHFGWIPGWFHTYTQRHIQKSDDVALTKLGPHWAASRHDPLTGYVMAALNAQFARCIQPYDATLAKGFEADAREEFAMAEAAVFNGGWRKGLSKRGFGKDYEFKVPQDFIDSVERARPTYRLFALAELGEWTQVDAILASGVKLYIPGSGQFNNPAHWSLFFYWRFLRERATAAQRETYLYAYADKLARYTRDRKDYAIAVDTNNTNWGFGRGNAGDYAAVLGAAHKLATEKGDTREENYTEVFDLNVAHHRGANGLGLSRSAHDGVAWQWHAQTQSIEEISQGLHYCGGMPGCVLYGPNKQGYDGIRRSRPYMNDQPLEQSTWPDETIATNLCEFDGKQQAMTIFLGCLLMPIGFTPGPELAAYSPVEARKKNQGECYVPYGVDV